MAYYPYWQRVPDGVSLVVRTSVRALTRRGALRAALRSEDPQLPIAPIRTMEEVVDRSVAAAQIPVDPGRSFLPLPRCWWRASAFTAWSLTRWRAAGTKSASGWRSARSAPNCSGSSPQGMTPVVVGLAAGVGAALLLGHAIRGLFFDVQPTDPATIAAVADPGRGRRPRLPRSGAPRHRANTVEPCDSNSNLRCRGDRQTMTSLYDDGHSLDHLEHLHDVRAVTATLRTAPR